METLTIIAAIFLVVIIGTMAGVASWYSNNYLNNPPAAVVVPAAVPVIIQNSAAVTSAPTPVVTPPPVPQIQAASLELPSKPVTSNSIGPVITPVAPVVTASVVSPSSGLATFAPIYHQKDGMCLDGNGFKAYPGTCNAGQFQSWNDNNGIIKQQQSGKCLDANVGADKTTSVYMNDCNATQFQAWTKNGNNYKHGASGMCLDSDGKSLYLTPCDANNDFQKWGPIAPTISAIVGSIQSIGQALTK